jgi:hypothetical protein
MAVSSDGLKSVTNLSDRRVLIPNGASNCRSGTETSVRLDEPVALAGRKE